MKKRELENLIENDLRNPELLEQPVTDDDPETKRDSLQRLLERKQSECQNWRTEIR